MLRRIVAVAFALGLMVVGSEAQTAAGTSSLIPLLRVLKNANVSASIELPTCTRGVPQFPTTGDPIETKSTVLQTVREMYTDHPDIEVTQSAEGIIRIVQRGALTDLLNVSISQIPFTTGLPPETRPIYNANAAVAQVFGAPEVQRFMNAHDITIPGGGGLFSGGASFTALMSRDGSIPPMPPTTPHVAGPLNNVTFSQALDYILGSFPGVWVYRGCPATKETPRRVEVWFFHLMALWGEWRVVE
jgi:hypothetical protein